MFIFLFVLTLIPTQHSKLCPPKRCCVNYLQYIHSLYISIRKRSWAKNIVRNSPIRQTIHIINLCLPLVRVLSIREIKNKQFYLESSGSEIRDRRSPMLRSSGLVFLKPLYVAPGCGPSVRI